jgi:membrane fusion protein (multidrug efflux system)
VHTELKRLKKPGTILGVIIALLLLLFFWQYIRRDMAQQFSKHSNNQMIAVEQGRVIPEVWHPQVTAVGSVKAVQGIEISAVIDGVVGKIDFISGQMVKEGEPLVEYVNNDLKADVRSSTASYEIAQLTYQRYAKLYKHSSGISREQLDEAKAEMNEAKGAMEKSIALLKQSVINAPFVGKLGLRQVSVGQFVAKGAPIVSLQQINPVYVDFDLSEDEVSQVKIGDQITLTTSAYPDQIFSGTITAQNSQLNVSTRTLSIRARVDNKKGLLVPGMFADVNVIVPLKLNVLTVPEMAVNYSPFGDSIFKIVGNKVKQIYVKAGEQRGSRVAITGKIKAGDKIVSSGVFKLQNGSEIKVVSAPTVNEDNDSSDTNAPIIKAFKANDDQAATSTHSKKSIKNAAKEKLNTSTLNLQRHLKSHAHQPPLHKAPKKITKGNS